MGHIGVPELIFVLLILIFLFGAKKLPEIGSSIGKAIKEFKNAGNEVSKKDTEDTKSDETKS
jgi:sec-independent protein translocase protein TatA